MRTLRLPILIIFLFVWISTASASANSGRNFVAHLTASQEVPANGSRATGQAIFQLSSDGTELHYQLIVANIENVVASHIHQAAAGQNGSVVVFLFGPAPVAGGPSNGKLAEGTITAANLTGPLAGQSLSVLIDQIEAGNTYVNVHTNDGVAPTNTGPGDIVSGEIRGQIR